MKKKRMGLGLNKSARRHRGGISPKNRLDVYWYKNKDLLSIEDLINIVLKEEPLSLRKRAVTHFLKKEDKGFNQFHSMLHAAEDILGKNKSLDKEFHKGLLKSSNEDQLVELIFEGNARAASEFFRKVEEIIKTGKPVDGMGSKKAKRILMVLFSKKTKESARKRLWWYIKRLNPETEELKDFLNTEGMDSILRAIPDIAEDITKVLRKNAREGEKKRKIIKRLNNLANQAKGQEEQRQE